MTRAIPASAAGPAHSPCNRAKTNAPAAGPAPPRRSAGSTCWSTSAAAAFDPLRNSMRVSAKAEYACIAMIELAVNYREPVPVRLKLIAEAHGIPQGFLVQILQQLKVAGLVASTRGASGGYQLGRPPEQIS